MSNNEDIVFYVNDWEAILRKTPSSRTDFPIVAEGRVFLEFQPQITCNTGKLSGLKFAQMDR